MSPLGFLTGVLLGSAAAIALVLAIVLILFLFHLGGQPALAGELPALVRSVTLFAALMGTAAAAFVAWQRRYRWRWLAQGGLWLTLAGVAWYYWPAAAR